MFREQQKDRRFIMLKSITYHTTYLFPIFRRLSALTKHSLNNPHLLPLPIQLHDFTHHFLLQSFPLHLSLRRSASLLPHLASTSFLLSLKVLLNLHILPVVALEAKLWSAVFDLNDNFRTLATVLEDVWGKNAGFLGSRSFSDSTAT